MRNLIAFLFSAFLLWLNSLRGGATFRQLAGGAWLGFALGLLPLDNGLSLLLFLLFCYLNVNGIITLIGFASGKMLRLGAPETVMKTGHNLLAFAPVRSVVAWCNGTPGFALLRLERYSVAGAIGLGVLLGLLFSLGLAAGITRLQRQEATRPGLQRGAVGWLFGLLTDRRTGIDAAYQYPSLLSISRLFSGLCATVVMGLLGLFCTNRIAKQTIAGLVGDVTGGEVTIEQVTFSPFSGAFELQNLKANNPQDSDHTDFELYRATGSVNLRALWMRHIVIRNASLVWLRLATPLTYEAYAEQAATTATELHNKPSRFSLQDARAYLQDAAGVNARLALARPVLEQYGATHPTTDFSILASGSRAPQAATDESLVPQWPAWSILDATLTELEIRQGYPRFTGELHDLTSQPALLGRPFEVAVTLDTNSLKQYGEGLFAQLGDQFTGVLDTVNQGLTRDYQNFHLPTLPQGKPGGDSGGGGRSSPTYGPTGDTNLSMPDTSATKGFQGHLAEDRDNFFRPTPKK